MEAYVMCQAGGTEKYLVIIMESAYDRFDTLQNIERVVCYDNHVQTTLVDGNLDGVTEVCLIDEDGIRRIEIEDD